MNLVWEWSSEGALPFVSMWLTVSSPPTPSSRAPAARCLWFMEWQELWQRKASDALTIIRRRWSLTAFCVQRLHTSLQRHAPFILNRSAVFITTGCKLGCVTTLWIASWPLTALMLLWKWDLPAGKRFAFGSLFNPQRRQVETLSSGV